MSNLVVAAGVPSGGAYQIVTPCCTPAEKIYIDDTRTVLKQANPGDHMIRTANADRAVTGPATFLSFDVNTAAQVSVLVNGGAAPSWLSAGGFIKTGGTLDTSPSGAGPPNSLFEVWTKTFAAGTVTLGPPAPPTPPLMYFVIIGPVT